MTIGIARIAWRSMSTTAARSARSATTASKRNFTTPHKDDECPLLCNPWPERSSGKSLFLPQLPDHLGKVMLRPMFDVTPVFNPYNIDHVKSDDFIGG